MKRVAYPSMALRIREPVKAAVLAAFTLSALAVPARAQTARDTAPRVDTLVVLPGDERLAVERLVPRRVTWRVTIRNADGSGTVQGLWTDVWVRSREEGRPVVEFRQLFVDTTGTVLVDNETVFDSASFRALRSTQHLPPSAAQVSYRFEGDSALGTLRRPAGAEPRSFSVVFHEPVWEPLTPVLDLLPFESLKPGMVVRYPIWNQTGPGGDVTWNTVRVDSVAPVEAADGSTVRAWHYTMTTDATPNAVFRFFRPPGAPYALWLRVERPGLTREWVLVDWQPFVLESKSEPAVDSAPQQRAHRAQRLRHGAPEHDQQ